MALRINTGLTTVDGGKVTGSTYIKFDIYFPSETFNYVTSMTFYRNEQAYIDGLRPYKPIEIPRLGFDKILTVEEYTGLTPTIVHNHLKDYLEGFVGIGNVEIALT